MLRPVSPLALLAALSFTALASTALAAPRVAVVVTSHAGLTEAQSDEVATQAAEAIAKRIEGEAIAGSPMRAALAAPVADGCQDKPECGRDLSTQLKTDEVLFLTLKRQGKKDIDLIAHRVARDPDRVPTEDHARLTGGKSRREATLLTTIAAIYPSGSVVPFVAKEAPPPVVAAPIVAEPVKPAETATPITKRKWFWPVVAGGSAVIIGGIIVIGVVASQPGPTGAPITLP